MRSRIAVFVATVQLILLLAHWFLYWTWTAFWTTADPPGVSKLAVGLALLSVSFVAASLLAWRYTHVAVRVFYTLLRRLAGDLEFLLSGGLRLLGN